MVRERWRPYLPENVSILKVFREEDGVKELAFVGYVDTARPNGDTLDVQAKSPEGLLAEMPLRFPAPRIHRADDPEGFEHWWRQLQYVFGLPDPRLFPSLPQPLSVTDADLVDRFVRTTHDLADSLVMNAPGEFSGSFDKEGEEQVHVDFPARDAQAGFTVFLRQCHADGEPTRYRRVYNVLWLAASAAADASRERRLEELRAWYEALTLLRQKSVRQLVRDRFVSEEGWEVFDDHEPRSPDKLLRIYQYGDLIHWGDLRGEVVKDDRTYEAARQRYEFFGAAIGLAHALVGFGELARVATAQPGKIYMP